jgi:hypothetical protein
VKKKIAAIAIALGLLFGATACGSDAKTASENVSKAADQFEVQRKIVGVNGITDKVAFEVEGRCSIEPEDRKLVVLCKHGDNDYRKHYVGLSDNTYWVAEQMEGIDVSVYHTRIVIRPEAVIPDFDLEGGKQ